MPGAASEPVSLAGERLVISAEVSASMAAKDDTYLNQSDYGQNALRHLAVGMTTALSLGERVGCPIGAETSASGVPLMSALRWDTGLQARVGNRPVAIIGAITDGSLSNPLVRVGSREERPAVSCRR